MFGDSPNLVAYAAVILFIPVSFAVFLSSKRPSIAIALLLAGDLLLPSRFALDLPGLPPLDKLTIPCLAVLLCLLYRHPRAVVAARRNRMVCFAPVLFLG